MGLTQQNIADELNISNKAVSKWEAGDCFPETAQLVALADLLDVSVDELLRGRFAGSGKSESGVKEEQKVSPEPVSSTESEKETRSLKSWQAVCIALGVALVLLGIVAMMIIVELNGETDRAGAIGVSVMFVFFAVAVFLFVYTGMSHNCTDRTEGEQKIRARRLSLGMGGSIAVLVLSLISVLLVPLEVYSPWIGTAIMFGVSALCVAVIVLCGLGVSRLDLPKLREKESPWSGVIMLTATAIFLLCGFLGNLWHPAWVVFPVGGILCGIVESVRNGLKK